MHRLASTAAAVVFGLFPLVGLAQSAPGNSTVNVDITTATTTIDYYGRVALTGAGGGTVDYLDPLSAFTLAEQDAALADALAQLVLPPATPLTDILQTLLGSATDFVETVDAGGAIFGTDYIGDPDNYLTWIAVGPSDVNVKVVQTSYFFNAYELSADIASAPVSAVPLPASAALLVAGLIGLGGIRQRRRG